MTVTPASPQEHTLRQILRLVDLGCDLERNLSDSEFVKNADHEIIPVLDENLFEMFVTPRRFREASETFYADLWSGLHHSRELWRGYETQAALLTSEFLLTRRLPGARNDTIYMTEFHWRELGARLDRIQNELEAQRDSKPNLYDEELARKLAVWTSLVEPAKPSRRGMSNDQEDPHLEGDLGKLRSRIDGDALDRIAAARRTTAVLARSHLVEPLDQVARIGSTEILDRIKTLQDLFRPVGRELKAIDEEAEIWFGRIAKELRTPGHRGRKRAQREDGGKAVWNDARAIAYLRWANRTKLQPNQRLVFITGDVLLFDAYRNWYFSDDSELDPAEPFFFRRVAQYTPLFNPNSTGGDLLRAGETSSSVLFSLIQQGVDAALIALPDMKEEESTSEQTAKEPTGDSAETPPRQRSLPSIVESITDKRREMLALKQVHQATLADDPELEPLVTMVSQGFVEDAANIIKRNRAHWQEIERLSIGTSFELIYGRMSDEQRAMVSRYADAIDDDASQILVEYAASHLEKLRQNQIRFWLAQIDSDTTIDDFPWRGPLIKRVSVVITFPSTAPNQLPENLAVQPDIVFASAALKAVETQDVASLSRFAGHALRAFEFRTRTPYTVKPFEFELKYLNAVAGRLSIASVHTHLRGAPGDDPILSQSAERGVEQVRTMYSRSLVLLHECIAAHYPASAKSEDQAIRYLRALSERASLNLFAATSFTLASEPHRSDLSGDANHYLELAQGDLRRCIEFDLETPIDNPLMDVVRAQFIPNIAGYEVLSYLMSEEREYRPANWHGQAKKKLLAFWENESHAHPLLAAELYGYGLLTDTKPPRSRKLDRIMVRRNISRLRLPLDRELYRVIYRDLLRDYL